MENITPPLLTSIRELRWRLASGIAMREALRLYLEAATSPFAQKLREWWALKSQGRTLEGRESLFVNFYQKSFVLLIERGCKGEPVLEHLSALEDEVEKAAEAELEAHVAALPFKVLIPLLLLQFPAYLVLLLGPLLRDLTRQMGG